MTHYWRCRRVKAGVPCGQLNLSMKKKCRACGKLRPKKRQPAHRAILTAVTYDECVAMFTERCGICGREPTGRKLHRDHEHKGAGAIRGLLCFRCNSALRSYMTLEWLRGAVAYLEAHEARQAQQEAA